MRLKVFLRKLVEYEAIEEDVNHWIEMNPNISVENVEQEVFENPKTREAELLLFLWYTEV